VKAIFLFSVIIRYIYIVACYLCVIETYINIIWENVSILNDYHNSVFANRRDDLTVVWVEVIF